MHPPYPKGVATINIIATATFPVNSPTAYSKATKSDRRRRALKFLAIKENS